MVPLTLLTIPRTRVVAAFTQCGSHVASYYLTMLNHCINGITCAVLTELPENAQNFIGNRWVLKGVRMSDAWSVMLIESVDRSVTR
jgi:hypothetical protein